MNKEINVNELLETITINYRGVKDVLTRDSAILIPVN